MSSLFDALTGGEIGSNFDLESRAADLTNQAGVGRGGNLGRGLRGMGINLASRPDLAKHALFSQAVADRFGPNVARVLGLGKEAVDVFRGGADQSDLVANEVGIQNSTGSFGDFLRDLFGRDNRAGEEIEQPTAFTGIRG